MENYFYKITNTINGKYYYGSGSNPNLYVYGGSSRLLNMAYKKYGKDNFIFEKLRFFSTREEAFLFEDRFLKLFNLKNDKMSYNLKNSGKGGDTISSNPNRKLIIEKIGRPGRTSNRKGILMTEEQKEKISKGLKESYENGRKKPVEKDSNLSEEHKRKISESSKGKHSGSNNGMWGRGRKIEVNGKVYPSIVICAKELDVHTKTVGYRLKNPRMETWRYIPQRIKNDMFPQSELIDILLSL